jgi:hypothetical protein
MFAAVSFNEPSERKFTATITVGGSQDTLLNWL